VSQVQFSHYSDNEKFFLLPEGRQMAVLEDKNTIISFNKLSRSDDSLHKALIPYQVRGVNKQGLNLKGAVINSCIGLSEENSALFQKEGDYGLFDQNMMR